MQVGDDARAGHSPLSSCREPEHAQEQSAEGDEDLAAAHHRRECGEGASAWTAGLGDRSRWPPWAACEDEARAQQDSHGRPSGVEVCAGRLSARASARRSRTYARCSVCKGVGGCSMPGTARVPSRRLCHVARRAQGLSHMRAHTGARIRYGPMASPTSPRQLMQQMHRAERPRSGSVSGGLIRTMSASNGAPGSRSGVWSKWPRTGHHVRVFARLQSGTARRQRDGATAWSEWQWTATQADGSLFDWRGATVVAVAGRAGHLGAPVHGADPFGGAGIDAAVREMAASGVRTLI